MVVKNNPTRLLLSVSNDICLHNMHTLIHKPHSTDEDSTDDDSSDVDDSDADDSDADDCTSLVGE